MRAPAFIFLLAAGGLASSNVFGGPISWTYSTTFANADNPSMPFSLIGDVGSGTSNSYITDASLYGRALTNEIGSQTVVAGTAFQSYYNAAYQSSPSEDPNFKLTIVLTDAASGQTGSVSFEGLFISEAATSSPMSMRLDGPSERWVAIGNNRYSVSLPYGGLGQSNVVADISVAPIVPTPEPASLVAMGCGLFLFGSAWAVWNLFIRRNRLFQRFAQAVRET